MGDFAYCHEWMGDLGVEDFSYCFLIDRKLRQFLRNDVEVVFYEPKSDVRDEVLRAFDLFRPGLAIFASGNGWDLVGQKGGLDCNMLNEKIVNRNLPLLGFDTKDGYENHMLDRYDEHLLFGTRELYSPPISKEFTILRNSPSNSVTPSAKHYWIRKRFEKLNSDERKRILNELKIESNTAVALFSVSSASYSVITEHFSDYYEHLSRLFQKCASLPVHFVIVTGKKIPAFSNHSNITQLPHLDYDHYSQLVKSCNFALSDTIWSTTFLLAACVSVPYLLICNSKLSPKKGADENSARDWQAVAGKLQLTERQEDDLISIVNRYKDFVLFVCTSPMKGADVTPMQYLESQVRSREKIDRAELPEILSGFLSTNHVNFRHVKSKFMEISGIDTKQQRWIDKIQSFIHCRSYTYNDLLEICNNASIELIKSSLDANQKRTFESLNSINLSDVNTGYDPLHDPFSKLAKARFKIENLFPYKVFPWGMEDISNYLVELYHLENCYREVEVFDEDSLYSAISELLLGEDARNSIEANCEKFQAQFSQNSTPLEIVNAVLSEVSESIEK